MELISASFDLPDTASFYDVVPNTPSHSGSMWCHPKTPANQDAALAPVANPTPTSAMRPMAPGTLHNTGVLISLTPAGLPVPFFPKVVSWTYFNLPNLMMFTPPQISHSSHLCPTPSSQDLSLITLSAARLASAIQPNSLLNSAPLDDKKKSCNRRWTADEVAHRNYSHFLINKCIVLGHETHCSRKLKRRKVTLPYHPPYLSPT